MPVFVVSEPRQRLALFGLALPILAVMGLFVWAGTSAASSPLSVVHAFIADYDTGQCQGMQSLLYKAPGSRGTTCAQLNNSEKHPLIGCKLATAPRSSALPLQKAPAGYSNVATILASCRQVGLPGSKVPRAIRLDFFVANSDSSGQQVILGVRVAGVG
ncbi:MAG: hypothetical protein ACYDGN_05430 [Acidimicrobiales bacterium]